MEVLIPIITALIGVIGGMAVVWYKDKLQRKETQCPVESAVDADRELMDKIEELRIKANADRASIYQFHNGGEFYTGKSMQKMSMTYEVVSKGVERLLPNKQIIPVSACTSTLKPLIELKRFFCTNVEDDYPESLCKFYLVEAGIRSTYIWAIYDLNKNLIGTFHLDFVKKKTKLNKTVLDNMEFNVIKMPGYLSKK